MIVMFSVAQEQVIREIDGGSQLFPHFMSSNHDPVPNESLAVRSDEQLRLELVLAATRMGAWDFHIETRKMSWDRQMHVLFGLAADSFGGRDVDFCELVHPDDRDRVAWNSRPA